MLNAAAGTDIRHVSYGGDSPAGRDLMAGKADYFCSSPAAMKPHVDAGRVKAPAVLSRARSTLNNLQATNWIGLFLSAATPEPIVDRLNAAAVRALADQAPRDQRRALGAEPVITERTTNQRLLAFLAGERAKWGGVIRAANIRLE